MATVIQIKRSANVTAPSTTDLLDGELAYSYDKAGDGAGAKLYIEAFDSGNNEVIHAIGGKFYTDAVDGATASNTANKIVKRDASGNFSAGIITANLYGTANTAAQATKLETTRYINLSGDATGTAAFDGTGNADITVSIGNNTVALGTDTTGDYVGNISAGTGIAVTGTPAEGWTPTVGLTNTGVAAATYGGATAIPVVAIDAQGRITSASNVAISTDLTIAGDSGTDTVSLASETLAVKGGTGISTAASGNAFTITNTGVTGIASGGYGLTVSAATGSVTVTNDGVTRIAAGTGISVDANNGNVTVTNNGVTQLTGTANEIEVSGSTGSITIGLPDNVTIGQNLTVTGDLIVNGTALTVNTATVTVEDPLVKFGNANPADSLDIGFFGQYTSSGTKFAGLFRDASDSGKFKLFVDLTSDPTTNVINTASYTVATLVANLTGGTVSGLTSAIGVADGGTGATTFTTNGVLYGQGTSALAVATGTAGQVLQLNGSGVPVFGGIDGGSY